MKTVLLPLLLIVFVTTACSVTITPAPTAELEIIETTLSTVTAEGILLPAPAVELAFAQGGVVSDILARPGESLAAGDVIAQLVGLETAQAELAASQLEWITAKKALNDLQNAGSADLAQAVINLKNAREEYEEAVDYSDYLKNEDKVPQTETRSFLVQTWKGYEYRIKTKHFKGPAPQDWIVEAENDLALDKARLDAAQRTYDRLKDGVDAGQLPVLEARLHAAQSNVAAAEAAIGLFELRAPFDGVLVSLDLDPGQPVMPGLPVAFLADTSQWTVETKDLAEIDVANVTLGAPVVVHLDAFPEEEFRGTVTEIDPLGREYLGDMTYRVTIAINKPDPRFMWNMTATVTIEVEESRN